MTASILYIVAQLCHAMIAFYSLAYKIERWHIFLSYQTKVGCKLRDLINRLVLMLNMNRSYHIAHLLLCDQYNLSGAHASETVKRLRLA